MKEMHKKIIGIVFVVLIGFAIVGMLYFQGTDEQNNHESDDESIEELYERFSKYGPVRLNIEFGNRVYDFSKIVLSDGSVQNTTKISHNLTIKNIDDKTADAISISLGDVDVDLASWAFEVGVTGDVTVKIFYISDTGFAEKNDFWYGNIRNNESIALKIYIRLYKTEAWSFVDNESYNINLIFKQEYPSFEGGGVEMKTITKNIVFRVRT